MTFRQKYKEIEAILYTGKNSTEVVEFLGVEKYRIPNASSGHNTIFARIGENKYGYGEFEICEGDWAVKESRGYHYTILKEKMEKDFEEINEHTEMGFWYVP